ncbi:MAG TPA: tRNA (adenosine(37)-N6)-threonylcarbamoyltransferase complex dimerization subunit type 1 TsaB [Propionibacteriaceae bacterium]|nr:tRNA (adenosine(37)-N6)-threonylcarbamoyltransferase complex dimerization subunit type 1 TsaB [Propionibacteriaceae bacterium]
MTTWTLGVDTSTDICVGLASDGVVVGRDLVADRRGHAEKLMPAIIALCAGAGIAVRDLDEVAVGVGPGPFTGLRVGIVTAHTLAFLSGTELHGVCSLDVLARQWVESASAPPTEFVVASDARRKELYWAHYDASGRRLGDARVSDPADIPALPLAGPGREVYPDLFPDAGGPTRLDAGILAAQWADLPDAGIEPLYLRKPDASVPTTRKSTLLQPRLQVGRR